jgi:sugar phosphate isomerase/epimerase
MINGTGYLRAFSTLGCPDFGLDAALALAADFKLDAVELRALGGSFDLPQFFGATYGTPAALVARINGQPIRVAALSTSLRLIGSSEAERAEFLKFVPWAEALGVRHLRVFDGGQPGDASTVKQAAAGLRWWRQLRAERGWTTDVMIETHDALLASDSILALVQQVPDVAILWDTHHTWRKSQEAPLDTWRRIKRQVVHVHVKDSVKSAAPPGYTYVAPGQGEFPMSALRSVLRAEFGGVVSLEWEKPWAPYLDSLESALRSAAAADWW